MLLPLMRLSYFVITIAMAGLLTACSGESPQEQCQGRGKNLLKDPSFSTVSLPRPQRRWFASEHAAGQSFEYQVQQNELEIHKTGTEPWFIMAQTIPREEIPGKFAVFSAEIKLAMVPPALAHGFEVGGGLTVTAMANGKPVVRSVLEHQPRMGNTGWQPVAVKVELPRNIESVRVGFLHQADGTLWVRNPSLRKANKADCPGE
ncbi:MAG: hypothetical protein V7720_10705 [Halioglobus sp.]